MHACGMCITYIRTTVSHINEDKRKTEGQMQMFEVLRDIDGCPVSDSHCAVRNTCGLLISSFSQNNSVIVHVRTA